MKNQIKQLGSTLMNGRKPFLSATNKSIPNVNFSNLSPKIANKTIQSLKISNSLSL